MVCSNNKDRRLSSGSIQIESIWTFSKLNPLSDRQTIFCENQHTVTQSSYKTEIDKVMSESGIKSLTFMDIRKLADDKFHLS